jgi:hypothetical protein
MFCQNCALVYEANHSQHVFELLKLKGDSDVYGVWYRAPLSPAHAFALALSVFK